MLIFGFNKQKRISDAVEGSSIPIMTVLPRPEELKGTSYRMTFNYRAYNIVKNHEWTIGQYVENDGSVIHFIMSVDQLPEDAETDFKFTVCSNKNLNHMKFWKYLKKQFNVKDEDELKFQMKEITVDGLNLIKLSVLTENFDDVEVPEDVYLSPELIEHQSHFDFDDNNVFEEVNEDTDDSFTFNA